VIKALEVGPAGRTIVLGLTWRNLDLLATGRPIAFDTRELGVHPGCTLLLAGGATTDTITADLADAGLDLPVVHTDGSLLVLAGLHPGGPRGIRRRVTAIGLTQAADLQLRLGGEFLRPLPDGLPAVRLLGGSTADRLAERITAGRTPQVVVDRTGGRTD